MLAISVGQFGQITVRERTDAERSQDRQLIGHSTDDARRDDIEPSRRRGDLPHPRRLEQ
jgi:hypothetical protein